MFGKLAPFLLLVALTGGAHAQTQPPITGTPEHGGAAGSLFGPVGTAVGLVGGEVS